jgi:hypothetical protein
MSEELPIRTAPDWPHLIAVLAFAGLAAATALTRSTAPIVLGRYSASLFVYQILNVATLGLLLAPARWERARWAGSALAVASTFLAPINEAVRQIPGILALLPAVRLLIAWSPIAAEFDRFRRGIRPRGAILAIGFALAALSLLDLILWAWVASTSGFDEDYDGYRDRYSLERVSPDDIVLVGDSFVWGHGVKKSERFGNVLQDLYSFEREGRPVRVYSLGVRGAGPERDLESLGRVPEGRRAGTVILSFYPNDLEPRPRARSKVLALLERVTWTLGRSSLTFRGLHDILGRIESPSLDRYHQSVIDDYRPDDPTFATRWADLAASLDRFAKLARPRSSSRPLLLIIPLMVDFRSYPLEGAHEALGKTAEGLGYDVLDLLPAFRAELGDGSKHRVHPGDNHFDARVHRLVAALIKEHLESARSRREPTTEGTEGRRGKY